jgi:hypothetical protein
MSGKQPQSLPIFLAAPAVRVMLGAVGFWATFVSMATAYSILNIGYRY